MPRVATNVVSAAAGLGAALAWDRFVSERWPGRRLLSQASGLTLAAAIYPLARSDREASPALARELGALAAFGALSVAAARQAGPRGARILAAGWVAHAVFDAVHESGDASRIPSWYPALCAGYDLAVAGRLLAAA